MSNDHVSVGGFLRSKREEKNVPLATASGITRISLGQIQALERDDFQALAAEVFVRGHLRNYAKFLELDPEEIVSRYGTQMEAERNRIKELQLAEGPPPPDPIMKSVWKVFMNSLSALVGFSPSLSAGKGLMPPRG